MKNGLKLDLQTRCLEPLAGCLIEFAVYIESFLSCIFTFTPKDLASLAKSLANLSEAVSNSHTLVVFSGEYPSVSTSPASNFSLTLTGELK